MRVQRRKKRSVETSSVKGFCLMWSASKEAVVGM